MGLLPSVETIHSQNELAVVVNTDDVVGWFWADILCAAPSAFDAFFDVHPGIKSGTQKAKIKVREENIFTSKMRTKKKLF